jgi:hypothetical protein
MISYEDFLPNYPDLDDPQFQDRIYRKREFNLFRLTRMVEQLPDDPNALLQHQRIIQRFMSPHTLYDELLLFHEAGTGKSRAAFGVTENLFPTKMFKRVYVFAMGDDTLVNQKKELVKYSARYRERLKDLDPADFFLKLNSLVQDFYTFETLISFTNLLVQKTDEYLETEYSNCIFIVDEVHRVRGDAEGVYAQLHRLFHNVRNRKILLLSATPMRDKVNEIADVMNLILPSDRQLEIDSAFNERYVDLQTFTLRNTDELKRHFNGRVSYIMASPSSVRRVFRGEVPTGLLKVDQFRLFTTEMEKEQEAGYRAAYERDTSAVQDGGHFYVNARQAALFVFPDGSFGNDGFRRHTAVSASGQTRLKDAFAAEVNTLSKLRRFSCKYAYIIEQLKKHPDKLTYIFCSAVSGSGVRLLSLLLEQYGFTRAKGTREEYRQPKRRFISLTSFEKKRNDPLGLEQQEKHKQKLNNLIHFFNHEQNYKGDYCQVVIGSRIISESFSFFNVQCIHVTTLHWNYTETHQAIARGIRFGSHDVLLRHYPQVTVEIYQHNAEPSTDVESIDMIMARTAQPKDVIIRRMTRILKESAFDCPLVYERNHPDNEQDNSQECDYQTCEYTCATAGSAFKRDDLDTYRLYYSEDSDQILENAIRDFFGTRFIAHRPVPFTQLQDELGADTLQLIRVLASLIRQNQPIPNRYGIACYLRESQNAYYLVDNNVLPNDTPEMGFYSLQPYVTHHNTLAGIIHQRKFELDLERVQRVQASLSEDDLRTRLQGLSAVHQEMFLERAYLQEGEFAERIQRLYANVTERDPPAYPQYRVVSSLLETGRRGLTRSGEWENVLPTETEAVETTLPVDQEGGVHALYGVLEKGIFKIVDRRKAVEVQGGTGKIDRRKVIKGGDCRSILFNKPKLAAMCVQLQIGTERVADYQGVLEGLAAKQREDFLSFFVEEGLSDPDSLAQGLYWYTQNKERLCTAVQQWFAQHNRLYTR